MNKLDNVSENNSQNFIFPDNLNFNCIKCGICCNREWNVYIGPKAYFGLKDTELYNEIKEKKGGEELFLLDLENKECIINKIDGKCPMLDEDNLCVIHYKMGFEEKPCPCRSFPHILAPTPEGIYVGLSFNCKGVTQSESGYIYNDDTIEFLKGVLEDSSDCSYGFEDVLIAQGVITDWCGYKVIESFAVEILGDENNIDHQLWKAFMTIAMLAADCKNNVLPRVAAEDISLYLSKPFTPPFEMDEEYKKQEFSFAMILITLLEVMEADERQKSLESLLQGGLFYCKSLNTSIDVSKLTKFIESNESVFGDKEFHQYLKHLIWRKTLIKDSHIAGSLAMLNIVKKIFKWYLYASAFTRGAEKPEQQDLDYAFIEVEEAVKHDTNKLLRKYSQDFAESIVKQVFMYMT